jgi:hypothetical protein
MYEFSSKVPDVWVKDPKSSPFVITRSVKIKWNLMLIDGVDGVNEVTIRVPDQDVSVEVEKEGDDGRSEVSTKVIKVENVKVYMETSDDLKNFFGIYPTDMTIETGGLTSVTFKLG